MKQVREKTLIRKTNMYKINIVYVIDECCTNIYLSQLF